MSSAVVLPKFSQEMCEMDAKLVRKPEGKKSLGKHAQKWYGSIKMNVNMI
jgi:hypothetical protein